MNDPASIPLIRLELSGMKYQVVHALMIHNREMEDAVESAVDAALNSFDFPAIVNQEVNKVVTEVVHQTIVEFFSFGEGRKILTEGVNEALKKVIHP